MNCKSFVFLDDVGLFCFFKCILYDDFVLLSDDMEQLKIAIILVTSFIWKHVFFILAGCN